MKVRTVRGELNSELSIRGLPKSLVKRIVARATFPNPAFETISKFGNSEWTNVQETVPFAWYYKGELTMTRGIVETMPGYIRNKIHRIKFFDTRTRTPVKSPVRVEGLSLVKEQRDC